MGVRRRLWFAIRRPGIIQGGFSIESPIDSRHGAKAHILPRRSTYSLSIDERQGLRQDETWSHQWLNGTLQMLAHYTSSLNFSALQLDLMMTITPRCPQTCNLAHPTMATSVASGGPDEASARLVFAW